MPPEQTRRNYKGQAIHVSYDIRRCIHASECVRSLPSVFNRQRVPWLDPEAASPGDVAEVVIRCPTGALRYERKDAGLAEPIARSNTITLVPNGPLYLRGDIRIISRQGEVLHRDTRLALCRCGASNNKPFCDNSHLKTNFQSGDAKLGSRTEAFEGDALQITPTVNGPYQVLGSVEIQDPDRRIVFRGKMIRLCRCGESREKPFCDNTHLHNAFQAQTW